MLFGESKALGKVSSSVVYRYVGNHLDDFAVGTVMDLIRSSSDHVLNGKELGECGLPQLCNELSQEHHLQTVCAGKYLSSTLDAIVNYQSS
jgi:hypothetical protein